MLGKSRTSCGNTAFGRALGGAKAHIATLAALGIVLVIGASRLFDPFSGDQALFLVGASSLHGGGVLYRDFWDIKQPGIFEFFLAGGSLFGFTQIGEYEADLLWQGIFALALVVGLRGALVDSRWAAFAPIAVVGAYYMGSSSWHLIQVEGLVGLPLFCCGWFALGAARSSANRRKLASCSGIAAGIVILFKLLFAFIALAILVAIVGAARANLKRIALVEICVAWIAGMLLPLAAFLCYALHFGIVPEVVTTNLWLPMRIAASVPHAPLERLADSAVRFVLYFRGILLLAAIGIAFGRDRRSWPWQVACWAWLGSGIAVILLQTQSLWQYHFLLLVPPVGILAMFGLALLASHVARGGLRRLGALAACGVVAYVAVPLPQAAIGTALRVIHERPFTSHAALERYRAATSTEYAAAVLDAALPARRGSLLGPIYVFGNPLIYTLAGRGQAVAMNGWALQLYTPDLWRRLDDELTNARPPYIFVLDGFAQTLIPAHLPGTTSLLARNYVAAQCTKDGRWYYLRASSNSSGPKAARVDGCYKR